MIYSQIFGQLSRVLLYFFAEADGLEKRLVRMIANRTVPSDFNQGAHQRTYSFAKIYMDWLAPFFLLMFPKLPYLAPGLSPLEKDK